MIAATTSTRAFSGLTAYCLTQMARDTIARMTMRTIVKIGEVIFDVIKLASVLPIAFVVIVGDIAIAVFELLSNMSQGIYEWFTHRDEYAAPPLQALRAGQLVDPDKLRVKIMWVDIGARVLNLGDSDIWTIETNDVDVADLVLRCMPAYYLDDVTYVSDNVTRWRFCANANTIRKKFKGKHVYLVSEAVNTVRRPQSSPIQQPTPDMR